MFGSKLSPMGQRIQALLDQKRWSQAELGRAAGLQRNVVNTTMRGSQPQPQNLAAIAQALGVTKEWLQGEPERPAEPRVLTITETEPGRARLVVDRIVGSTLAARIALLIAEDDG